MPSLLEKIDAHQDRLLARADRTADAAERVVRRIWLDLVAAIKAGGPWFRVQRACAHILKSLPQAAHIVAEDLAGVAQDSAQWTAETLVEKLTERQAREVLRRRGVLFEAERGEVEQMLIGAILPTISVEQVNQVLFAHGWLDRLKAMTKLADPETLASRIASLVQDGFSISSIAREIRPVVQGVQASARRVARTAGLWIAHEAEFHTYEQLGTMVSGYQIHAVLDHATRPEHRKRDGRKYYREPRAGQRGFGEMPRPPREADGKWAFNCRCFLSPILAGG